MYIQFRIRPIKSLLDANPKAVKKVLYKNKNVKNFKIFDDRISDATFITLIVERIDEGQESFRKLKTSLKKIPKVRIFLVDINGNELSVDKVSYGDIKKFRYEEGIN